MLAKRNRTMSVVMAICLCLAVLAPVFVVAPAQAAGATYSAVTAPTIASTGVSTIGSIKVVIEDGAAIAPGDVLTFSLPSEVTLPNGVATAALGTDAVVSNAAYTPGGGASWVNVVVPQFLPGTNTVTNAVYGAALPATGGTISNVSAPGSAAAQVGGTGKSLDINFQAAGSSGQGVFYVYFNRASVAGLSGDLSVTISGSNAAVFAMGNAVIGNATSSKGTAVTVKSVKSIGTSGATDTITLIETVPGSVATTEVIRIKLPAGFSWDTHVAGNAAHDTYVWNWSWDSNVGSGGFAPNGADTRVLELTMPAFGVGYSASKAGRVDIIGTILVDDSVAKKGDVTAHISSSGGNVTEQDIVIAKYGDYSATLTEGTKTDLVAGRAGQKIGTFYLEEGLPGSLVANRTIKLTLPEGAKWYGGYSTAVGGGGGMAYPALTYVKGTTNLITMPTQAAASTTGAYATQDNGRTLLLTMGANVSTSKAKIEFKNYRVDLQPDFTGDLKVTASGLASATGEVVVANVKSPVELAAASKAKVRIGERNQALGDITIKETTKGAVIYRIEDTTFYNNLPTAITAGTTGLALTLSLPAGARWAAGFPTVEVTEGDLDLNEQAISKALNAATGIDTITIPIKSEGSKPSTIKISGMKAHLDRTIPEGDFSVAVGGTSIDQVSGTGFPFAQFEGLDVAAAEVITPAPDQGTEGAATGTFKIGSNIYEVNGVAKVMDAAPYIKAGRTYMPIRFLGYAMGLTDADIVWDEATQKVTMTKGSNVVELTVGSTTITVNGEAKTMDVAPEISNGRTMLPARFVAEGLGYVVGWDAGTQTILISK